MNAAAKIRLCDALLGCSFLVILASGLQLEATSGRYVWSVWAHIVAGMVFVTLSYYHIFLHYRRSNWFRRFAKNKSTVTRILWWMFLLTAVSGVIATMVWIDGYCHTPMGGVHGKLGLVMTIVAVVHVVQKRRHRG